MSRRVRYVRFVSAFQLRQEIFVNCSTAFCVLVRVGNWFRSKGIWFSVCEYIWSEKENNQKKWRYIFKWISQQKICYFRFKKKIHYYRNESGDGMLIPETKIVLRWILRRTKFCAIICLAFETHKIWILLSI